MTFRESGQEPVTLTGIEVRCDDIEGMLTLGLRHPRVEHKSGYGRKVRQAVSHLTQAGDGPGYGLAAPVIDPLVAPGQPEHDMNVLLASHDTRGGLEQIWPGFQRLARFPSAHLVGACQAKLTGGVERTQRFRVAVEDEDIDVLVRAGLVSDEEVNGPPTSEPEGHADGGEEVSDRDEIEEGI